MKIRYADPADATAIVSLAKAGFRQELLNAMIYSCSGIVEFVERQISIPQEFTDTVYIVAESNKIVVGFVEFKIYSESIFLNYIGTSPEFRHKGLGLKLFGESVLMIRTEYHKSISLDVFSDNVVARSWYERLGFAQEYNLGWYRILQPNRCEADHQQGRVSGYSQSKLCYEKFGFSHFNVATAKGEYAIGMLGQEWFRVTQSQVLFDGAALSCLNLIDSNRVILGLFKEKDLSQFPLSADCFCHSIRMNIQLDRFSKNTFY